MQTTCFQCRAIWFAHARIDADFNPCVDPIARAAIEPSLAESREAGRARSVAMDAIIGRRAAPALLRLLSSLALMLAAVSAQTHPVVDALIAGETRRAFELLEKNERPEDEGLRLSAARRLIDVAKKDTKVREPALRWSAELLPAEVPAKLAEEHKALALEVGKELTRVLVAHTDDISVDGRIADRTHLAAGIRAQQALHIGGAATSGEMLALGVHLAPLLLEGERPQDAVEIAQDALAASKSPEQETRLHWCIATGLLQINRPRQALRHAQIVVQADPTDAKTVLAFAQGMPSTMAKDVFPMLGGVIRSAPRAGMEPAWSGCLKDFWDTVDDLAAKKATADLVKPFVTYKSMPQKWDTNALWGEGYRVYVDSNYRPAKTGSGKDGIYFPVPQSHGWRTRDKPPDDLVRWQTATYCVERGEGGPTFVVYWFGPHREFWYGFTPREREKTSRTWKGTSAGSILGMLDTIAYGEDATRRQQKFKPHREPPFRIRASGQDRRTYALGDTVYYETVVSHGEVTVEVLLRATEEQLRELEPELRWMFENFRLHNG